MGGGALGLAGRAIKGWAQAGRAVEAEAFGTGGDRAISFARNRTSSATSLDGLTQEVRFADLPSGAQRLVQVLERKGWTGVGGGVQVNDLRLASMYLDKEVGVVQSATTGNLRAVLGNKIGISRDALQIGEFHVAHTHPMFVSDPSHFRVDISNAGSFVEAVIDWGGNITHYNKTGILDLPSFSSPINGRGYIVGYPQ